MREILFRGKFINNGEWLYGDYMSYAGGAQIWTHDANGGTWNAMVDPVTVGQYTGLTDKNGVKIFEGDVVDFFGMRGKIVHECGAFGIGILPRVDYDLLESKLPFKNSANFCFNDNFISLWEVLWNYEQGDNPLFEVEVIGNIHDNPELLKGGAGNG